MAYAVVRRKRRLSNPGRRRKKMTAKQIRFFGTKRQRAALRGPRRRRNTSVRKTKKRLSRLWKGDYKFTKAASFYRAKGKKARAAKRAKRKKNVGSILVASIPGFTGLNPGRKRRKTVARHRRRRKANAAPRRRRRHYSARRRRNPGRRRSARVVVKYRTRGRRHHRRGRRRGNPGFGLGNDATVVAGIITGAAVTRIVTGFVPPSLQAGVPGYVVTAIAAVLQGQLVGKALKKPQFGKYMTWGGLTFLGLKVINDFMPSLSGYIPFGLSGLGLLSPSQGFMLPSVNRMGSMGSFVAPGIVTSAIAAAAPKGGGMHGLTPLNTSARRTGRIQ